MNKEVKVAAYIRVSTIEQASEDKFSLKSQLDTIKKHCEQEGYTIHDVYADRGVSGTSRDKRLELERLMNDAKEGQFSKLMVFRISRLARNTKDLLQIVEELQSYDVEFKSISERFELSSTTGKMIAQILASFSEYEANVIRDNTAEGLLNRVQHSRLTNGSSALGYNKPESSHDPLVVNEHEAEIVRMIFDMYETGSGFRAIANMLNNLGYQTKKGNSFGIPAVKYILYNPIYVGKVRYRNYIDWNTKRRRGKNANPIIVQGKHVAIISESQWNRVQEQLRARSKQPKVLGDGSNLLTGLVKCPQCRSAMTASNTTNKLKNGQKKRIRYYSCGKFRSGGATVCSANSVRAEDIEAIVEENILKLINQPDVLKKLIEKANERAKEYQERQKQLSPHIQEQVEELALKISNLTSMIQTDDSLAPILGDKLEEYKVQLREKQGLIHQGESAKNNIVPVEYSVENMQQILDKIRNAFSTENKMNIKQLYLSIIDHIIFTKSSPRKIDEITIYLEPEIGQTLIDGMTKDEDPSGASSFSMPPKGIILQQSNL